MCCDNRASALRVIRVRRLPQLAAQSNLDRLRVQRSGSLVCATSRPGGHKIHVNVEEGCSFSVGRHSNWNRLRLEPGAVAQTDLLHDQRPLCTQESELPATTGQLHLVPDKPERPEPVCALPGRYDAYAGSDDPDYSNHLSGDRLSRRDKNAHFV